ncbi:MAG: sigma-70 family RNA polymerase sigma factor [bacterium]
MAYPFDVPLASSLMNQPDRSNSMDEHIEAGSSALRAAVMDTRSRFLESAATVRPRLHRFCARMTGSVLDGEDLVQETLAQAFYSLASLQDPGRLESWLFQIAHNKCVDFLRRRTRTLEDAVPYDDEREYDGAAMFAETGGEPVDDALASLVTTLPPMERAAVLLKDVLDYRLSEVAEVVDSTVGGVKAALHRGRTKLRERHETPPRIELEHGERMLLASYVERFNRRDWDGLRHLIQADVRMELVGMPEARATVHGTRPTYFGNYMSLPWEWKFGLARVDGESVVVLWRKSGAEWLPYAAVRLWWRDGLVVRIRDYIHVDYLLKDAQTELDTPVHRQLAPA